ncbi:hypothetical protein GMRT_13143 [Giardia muris]|uniref:Proteasome activator pa28 beta subunit n=1 Tax=Giardia muris TaxID=5742 RepID=A0A4Z1SYB5_GIAMU|nr:hypothetical protein GMRT_13143 [Giardia muris]|eukprot:TNJ26663.1 hypothetical protein GMRT_13143 [Giardia muris]
MDRQAVLATQVQRRLAATQRELEELAFVEIPEWIARLQTLSDGCPYLGDEYLREYVRRSGELLREALPSPENPEGETQPLQKKLAFCPPELFELQNQLHGELNALRQKVSKVSFALVYMQTRDEYKLDSDALIEQAATHCGNLYTEITTLMSRASPYHITRAAFVAKFQKSGLFDLAKSIIEIDNALLLQYAADVRSIQSHLAMASYALVRLFKDQRASFSARR